MADGDQVRLLVADEVDDDPERAAELTRRLRRELDAIEVERIEQPSGRAPPGAKGDALQWAELLVTLSGSLPGLVALVRSWVSRNEGAAVTLEIGGDRLTLEGATTEQRRALVDAFLSRHGAA